MDLTDASIVAGGMSYNSSRYTQADTVGHEMFKGSSSLEKLKFPDGIKVIEENAFRDCESLITLVLPTEVSTFLPSAGCPSLTTIEVPITNTQFTVYQGILYNKACTRIIWLPEGRKEDILSFPPTLKSIGDYSFEGCLQEEIVFPPALESLGKGAFHASHIRTIVIPDQVRILPYAVFQKSNRLTRITLGKSIELISNYCFDGCPVEHLHLKMAIPPVCMEQSFAGAEKLFTQCVLHIPAGSFAVYTNNHYWGKFLKIVEE